MRRYEVIQFRLDPAEKRRIVEIARNRGQTLSDFLRQSAAEATERVAA